MTSFEKAAPKGSGANPHPNSNVERLACEFEETANRYKKHADNAGEGLLDDRVLYYAAAEIWWQAAKQVRNLEVVGDL